MTQLIFDSFKYSSAWKAKIVDPETGEIVPVNTPGELCTRGYNTMLGYWNDPDKTSETIKSDRWLHSGYSFNFLKIQMNGPKQNWRLCK